MKLFFFHEEEMVEEGTRQVMKLGDLEGDMGLAGAAMAHRVRANMKGG